MVFGLIMVFLILAGQYEKWSLPGECLGRFYRAVWRAARNFREGLEQRYLFPDRADDADRACGQERDPDL